MPTRTKKGLTNRGLSREDILRVRKLEQALKELREGKNTYFSITKLTSIKGLCKDEYRRNNYCLHLASLVMENAEKDERKQNYRQIRELLQEAYGVIIGLVEHNKEKDKTIARETLLNIRGSQNEVKQVKWTTVRIIKSNNLLILENILQALLSPPDTALMYVFDATKHYVEEYNPKYGTGLIVDSIPMLERIIDFWRKYE